MPEAENHPVSHKINEYFPYLCVASKKKLYLWVYVFVHGPRPMLPHEVNTFQTSIPKMEEKPSFRSLESIDVSFMSLTWPPVLAKYQRSRQNIQFHERITMEKILRPFVRDCVCASRCWYACASVSRCLGATSNAFPRKKNTMPKDRFSLARSSCNFQFIYG